MGTTRRVSAVSIPVCLTALVAGFALGGSAPTRARSAGARATAREGSAAGRSFADQSPSRRPCLRSRPGFDVERL
jgi:hypothetical protein